MPAYGQDVTPTADGFLRSGRVADAGTREPLSEAIVEVPELGIRVISDQSGRVELGRLPAGEYRITAERIGYEILAGELPVPWNAEFLILLEEADVDDPQAPGRIVGRVMVEGGNGGLSDVDITVLGPTQVRTVSDPQGRFNLRDLEPGLSEIRFTRLGYAPRTATLIVHPGRSVDVSATMSTQPIELEAIKVTVRSSYLERNGFYRRTRSTWGSQFTRKNLDTIDPMFVSDLLWRVPGVRVRYGPNGAQAVGRRRCVLPVYLDGIPMVNWDLDQLPPEWLEAAEIFHGLGTPIQYGGGCGVVLIWTRRGP